MLKKQNKKISLKLNVLFRLKMHIGYLTHRWNYYMHSFIIFKSKNLYLLNLVKTLSNLKLSLFFITNIIYNRGRVALIEKNQDYRKVIDFFFKLTKQYIFSFRWFGGIFSNFKEFFIKQKINPLLYKKGVFWYEKKTTLLQFKRLPEVVLILSGYDNSLALNESISLGIPLISVLNSDMNPSAVNFVLPGKDSNFFLFFFLLSLYTESIYMGFFYERKLFYSRLKRYYLLKFIHQSLQIW
jgi:small subunit ribosomal protein S2